MLRQRVITAVVLVAALLAAAAAGRTALAVAFAVLIGAAAFEWLRLARHPVARATALAAAFAAALFALEVVFSWPRGQMLSAVLAVATVLWLVIAGGVLRAARRGGRLAHSGSTLLAFALLAAAWCALLRLLDGGFLLLLSVLAIVWLADIAAYFAGRKWGRRKLAPAISPGKTWAGVGGAVAAVLLVALAFAFLAPQLPLFSTLLLQRQPALGLAALVALVAVSIVGDLFESLLKRQVEAKDSGRLLPGHGGVLDRVDALIAVLPAAALLDLWLRR